MSRLQKVLEVQNRRLIPLETWNVHLRSDWHFERPIPRGVTYLDLAMDFELATGIALLGSAHSVEQRDHPRMPTFDAISERSD